MPWKETSIMSSRTEFVALAHAPGANIRQLCRRFGISSRTAYKWLARYADAGAEGLPDRSRRPHHSPRRTPPAVEAQVLGVRQAHPAWGGRKIHPLSTRPRRRRGAQRQYHHRHPPAARPAIDPSPRRPGGLAAV